MIIKVCGIIEEQNMEAITSLPIEMVGLNFYPPSKRFLPYDNMEIIDAIPAHVEKVGVLVNESADKAQELINDFDLDYLQLHGLESYDYCEELAEDCKLIKAFGIEEGDDIDQKVEGYEMCQYLLFDTKTPQHGGSGRKFDWNTLESYTGDVPFLLSGGIGPDDYDRILEVDHPMLVGVDINSKFEISPGIKNVESVASFVENLRRS